MFVQPRQIPNLQITPHNKARKHKDTKKDRNREIEKTNILWMFVFVFSAGFFLVECMYLLLRLLSCSSYNEVHSWPLLLLLIEFSQTPAPSALLSPYSEREKKNLCVTLRRSEQL